MRGERLLAVTPSGCGAPLVAGSARATVFTVSPFTQSAQGRDGARDRPATHLAGLSGHALRRRPDRS
jgi:hypothetical protein